MRVTDQREAGSTKNLPKGMHVEEMRPLSRLAASRFLSRLAASYSIEETEKTRITTRSYSSIAHVHFGAATTC
jgi:hypothetical protein